MRQAEGLITNQLRHPEQFCLRFTGRLQPQNDVGAEFPLRVECACMRKSFPRPGINERGGNGGSADIKGYGQRFR